VASVAPDSSLPSAGASFATHRLMPQAEGRLAAVRGTLVDARCSGNHSMDVSRGHYPDAHILQLTHESLGRANPRAAVGVETDQPHCALMFAARMTLPHFSVSAVVKAPNSAAVKIIGVAANAASTTLTVRASTWSQVPSYSATGLSTRRSQSKRRLRYVAVF